MAKKIKKYKVGMDSETYAISLVEAPAMEETLVALNEQTPVKVQLANEEKHMVYSAVLIPDKPIYRRDESGNEYYLEFTKESIEHMSQDFLKNYYQNEITIDHETMASDITVVETWLKSDMYKDKSVALGLNEQLPIGTWFAGMKVNQIDVWDRIKSGDLKGFSVESLIKLEEFNTQNTDNSMNIEDNMGFWSKLAQTVKDAFKAADDERKMEQDIIQGKDIEPIAAEDMEQQTPDDTNTTPNNTTVEPSDSVSEPDLDNTKAEENNAVVDELPKQNEAVENVVEETPKQDNHLEELINNMRAEIDALKQINEGLQNKVNDLSKTPSTKPINTNAKTVGVGSDTYSAWRETMRGMLS